MGAPRGHSPYKGCKKGGAYGYLGKPKDAYTEKELDTLGQELLAYMSEERNVWYKGFCNRKKITEDHFQYLIEKYPIFASYARMAKQIQKEKLITHPFWKEADGNFAKFILAHSHDEFKEEKQDLNQHYTYNVNYGSPSEVLPKTLSAPDSKSLK